MRIRRQIWVPWLAGLGALSLTVVLWSGLQAQEEQALQRLLAAQAVSMREAVEQAMRDDGTSLRRMARRWEVHGGTPRAEWDADAAEYLRDNPDFLHIDWVDASGIVRWVTPQRGFEAVVGRNLLSDPLQAEALERARTSGGIAASRQLDLVDGETGFFLVAPLEMAGRLEGYLRVVFHSRDLLRNHLDRQFVAGSGARVDADGRTLFTSPTEHEPGAGSAVFAGEWLGIYGLRWRFTLYPTPTLTRQARSALPSAVLLAGTLLSLLLVLAMHWMLTARSRERESRAHELRLADSERRYRTLLESMTDGMFVAQDERFVFCNPALPAMLDYTPAEFLGLPFSAVVAPAYLPLSTARFHERLAAPTPSAEPVRQSEVQFRKKGSDALVWLELMAQKTTFNGRSAVLGLVRDIGERKRAEEHRALLAVVFDEGPDAILVVGRDGRIVSLNHRAGTLFGYSPEALQGQAVEKLLPHSHAARHAKHRAAFFAAPRVRTMQTGLDLAGRRADGSEFPVDVMLSPVRFGDEVFVVAIVRDITDRKRVEKEIANSLREKEVLLKEVYHRVKNNLQVIQSLLNLQRRALSDGAAREAMTETADRIHAMALVHEQLYQSGSLASIPLAGYAGKLLQQIAESSGAPSRGVVMRADIEAREVGPDVAVPLGLLLNELVSNAIKHAFPDGRTGEVQVRIKSSERGLLLTVADDGVGLRPGLDPANSPGLGLKLATGLAQQLGGKLTVESKNGTRFSVEAATGL